MSLKTSIILCTYNEAQYIENAILELEKYVPNLELIIVDDSSNDLTQKIINNMNDSRIKLYVNDHNMGVTYTFERAINISAGDIIFLASFIIANKSSELILCKYIIFALFSLKFRICFLQSITV